MIRILIVDDQNFTRKALGAVFNQEPNFFIVGEAENGVKALEIMDKEAIEIAVVDLDMPEMNGFELTKKIRQNFPQTKVIILSGRDDRDSINKAVNLGARGYLLKNTSTVEVIDTINYVQRGYFQLGPGLFEKLISQSINYELETAEHLSELETKSEEEYKQLKQEMLNQHELVRQDIFAELELKIDDLKSELKQGLNKFQGQVSQRLQSGFDNLENNPKNSQFVSDFWQQRYRELSKSINLLDNKYQLSLSRISKETLVLRYCLIFLLFIVLSQQYYY
ncbi:MAG: response regulator transcription factor [Cyanobacteria bacterium J06558_2]